MGELLTRPNHVRNISEIRRHYLGGLRVFAAAVLLFAIYASAVGESNINSENNSSWGANIGWINWQADGANGAVIGEYVLGGFIYSANVGWINLGNYNPANHISYQNNSATDFGVNVIRSSSTTAQLRGYAWGANIGWINFEDTGNPTLDLTNRKLHGYAYGANVGWINLGELGVTLVANSIAPGIDTNNNGIADAFEQIYFGQQGIDPNADPDADGLTNLQEYEAGLDPTFPNERLLNISTRLPIQTGENVLIGGFIITGNQSKRVIVRGLGPSLAGAGVEGALDNPTLELHGGDTSLIAANDNWQESQAAEINGTGIPPSDNRESAIVQTLLPGSYTAVLAGKDQTTGIGLVEAFDLDQSVPSRLANISTRGFVGNDDSVLIGGFIIGPSNGGMPRVIARAIGPSLTAAGVQGALEDPLLELHDANGTVATNDDWKQAQEAEIEATGIPPSDERESAIVARLAPGNYTAVVRGKNGATGVGLVEVFNIP